MGVGVSVGAWAWGRIGWLTGCRGSRAFRRRPTNSCHAACVSRPLATHQARRTVVVAMQAGQASRPAGQSGLSNDTMRWSECTGPAHPRLAACVPGQPGPLTVSILAHRFPVFGRGLHTVDATCFTQYSTAHCTGPSLGAMEDQIRQRDAAPGVDQAHFRKGGILKLTSITMPIVAVPSCSCRTRTTRCFTPQLHHRAETCARQEPAWPVLFSPSYGALSQQREWERRTRRVQSPLLKQEH